MKVIVGLGNPGEQYARTPHNIGFMVVDRLAERLDCRLRASARFQARQGTVRYGGNELLLAEPQTFMNQSGRAVGALLAYRKLGPADLIVVVDDADLPLGALRLRKQGGTAGHRGLMSIAEAIGSNEFARVRVGIGRGRPGADLVEHVLGAFNRDEWEAAAKAVDSAGDAVLCTVEHGMDAAMNRFNTRRTESDAARDGTAGGKEA